MLHSEEPSKSSADENFIPITIQAFLWKQLGPFIRPKFGKLHETSCPFCQHSMTGHHTFKEACKTFEKVLVQNLQSGLKPDLVRSIRSLPRWKLIETALPYVMHSVAALLNNRIRDGNLQSLTPFETKLMYTLHWSILDAAEECVDGDSEKGILYTSTVHYLFPVTTIALFVYLFAPICHQLKENDFQNFRLENGLKLWQPLWEFRHPDVPCFTTPCKSQSRFTYSKGDKRKTRFGDVFIGRKPSYEAGRDTPPSQGLSGSSSDTPKGGFAFQTSATVIQATTTARTTEDESGRVSSPKETVFPETIPEESSSTEEEHVVIFRLPSLTESNGKHPSIYTAETSLLQFSVKKDATMKGGTTTTESKQFRPTLQLAGSLDKESTDSSKIQSTQSGDFQDSKKILSGYLVDICAATIMDVAVLRCLFARQWLEEGTYWALHFLYNRLRDISEDMTTHFSPRKRSDSLPNPKLDISFLEEDELSSETDYKDTIEIPEVQDVSLLTEAHYQQDTNESTSDVRRASKKSKKRLKMTDLKALVESKILSKSDKALERIEQEEIKSFGIQSEHHHSLDTGDETLSRPSKRTFSVFDTFPSNLVKGKSMPSLSHIGEFHFEKKETPKVEKHAQHTINPIITVTEHTPIPSPAHLKKQMSFAYELDASKMSFNEKQADKVTLIRSRSDSSISYYRDKIIEAPGSASYITKTGELDLYMVLRAMYVTSLKKRCTIRILEVLLNILELLIILGVLKQYPQLKKDDDEVDDNPDGADTPNDESSGKDADSKKEYLSSHWLLLETVIKVLKHLGCPHACTEGLRGPAAEFLRTQSQNILTKVKQSNGKSFKLFFKNFVRCQTIRELLHFYHSYLGFCMDPNSLLSPLNQKRSSSKSPSDTMSQGGYSINFDIGLGIGGGSKIRGVESDIISYTFKLLVSKFLRIIKRVKLQEHMGTYCEIRQFMTYVKEGHAGTFRRVTLSSLLDSADRPLKKDISSKQVQKLQSDDQNRSDRSGSKAMPSGFVTVKKPSDMTLKVAKDTSLDASPSFAFKEVLKSKPKSGVEATAKRESILVSRLSEQSLSITDGKSKSKTKLENIVNWFKKGDLQSFDEQDLQDNGESAADTTVFFRSGAKYYGAKVPVTVNVTETFQRAKRKVGNRINKFVAKKKRIKGRSFDDVPLGYPTRRMSIDFGDALRGLDHSLMKAKKLVPIVPIYDGLLRLSFLLETCPPGSVPDAQLLVSILDLPHTTVVARAGFLLECAHFVHCCNKNQWPHWMKMNFIAFRPSGSVPSRGSGTAVRKAHLMQRAAGKMFHQWAELLGHRLAEMINEDKRLDGHIANMLQSEQRRRELQMHDEEENFLDEASIHNYGVNCSIALRFIVCVLLQEITAFLRETYQTLPKSAKVVTKKEHPHWDRLYSKDANRRWSMALSSMGHSQVSAQSLQSIAGEKELGSSERKISFVLHEPDESEGSSNTTLGMQTEEGRKTVPASRPYLLRRGTTAVPGGSFKRRSLKLRRGTKEGKELDSEWRMPESVRRADSIQSKRKISLLSDRSDNSEPGAADISEEESPGALSDEQPLESPTDANEVDEISKNMPWLKTMIQLSNSLFYFCGHENYCHPFCYRRVMRSCSRLVNSIRKIYGDDFGYGDEPFQMPFGEKIKKEFVSHRKPSDQSSYQATASAQPKASTAKARFSRSDKIFREETVSRDDISDKVQSDSDDEEECLPKPKSKDKSPVLKYIKTQVLNAFHSPFGTLLKGAVLLTEDNFSTLIPVTWKLLLESNRELVATAACLFILAAVKAPQQVTIRIRKELTDSSPLIRIRAMLKFQVLWKMRYHVWPRMEENAHLIFKVPPPGIEFTLPSPKIGIESLDVVDSPWELFEKTKVEEVTINQERHRALVTATKTRKKQQTELIKMAIQAQDDKKRLEREQFLITSIPITIQAAHEPSLRHTAEEHEEIDEEQLDGPVRNAGHHLQPANSLFPSCLCSAVLQIINHLDDAAVAPNGDAVYTVAYHVIWNCLVEDSALFLRYILERLTREKQNEMFKILRHLIRFIPRLPQQAAFALYNYIIGYIMFYVRGTHEDGQILVGAALSILWMVVHSVHGIMFKDLKQILRKEQCDASILLTANVPWAKKIIVHGPQDMDSGAIPSQFPVQEDTQFCQILSESLDFFSIDESRHHEFYLVDYKTRRILNPSVFVRDVYFFKRSQYPQLQLTFMKPEDAFNALQKEELVTKFVETGKVLLTWAILKNVDMVVQRVVFLHEELMKLPSFPRKALESTLDLYNGGILGKELLGLDVLHKFMWVRLIARMFEAMAGNFAYSSDIHLFLNVLNGSVILHSQDAGILRYVMATYINAAFHFKNIFANNGYLLIMPTLLKIYSNHQTNKLVTTTVEYAVKQFYLMNRKPFILQMFGSLSSMLDTDEESTFGDAHKIQSSCLFNLLLSLETPSPDPLSIGELVKEEKPLKPIDFCYHDENEMVTILDCISLCVMVVSFSADSVRGCQMLIILEAILPCYVRHIQLPTYNKEGKTELDILHQLSVSIKTLVNNCEALTKSYNGPYRSSPEHKASNQKTQSYSSGFDFDDEPDSKFITMQSRSKNLYDIDGEDSENLRTEYRRPRDVLLSLVGEFVCTASQRINELQKDTTSDGKTVELLDVRSHIRLSDVAHSLLKVSPYDPDSMGCRGLQFYMQYILPSTEWTDDAMRPALVTILRRMDKVFQKILKKPSIRRNTNWDAASGLLKAIYDTMLKYPYIIYWQHIKTLINTCQAIIISDYSFAETPSGVISSQIPPSNFCSMVVRLIALQLQNNTESCTLEQICGGTTTFSTQDKTENVILNLIMPLCLRMGSGKPDVFQMKQADINFMVTLVLQAMNPPSLKATSTSSGATLKVTSENRSGSLTFTGIRDSRVASKVNTSLYQVAFLALKIIIICFAEEIVSMWMKIVRIMRELAKRNEAVPHLWDFLDFIVTHRTPLFILMQPFIFQKLAQPPISDFERGMHSKIRDKLRCISLPFPKGRGTILMELVNEMKELKDEIEEVTTGKEVKRQETTMQLTNEIAHRQQRPSIIGLLTGEGCNQNKRGSITLEQAYVPFRRLSTTAIPLQRPNNIITTPSSNNENNATDRDSHRLGDDQATQQNKPETAISQKAHKLRFVSTVEFKPSGEATVTPIEPSSPVEEYGGDLHPTRSRLQRVKPQSRKTFRIRRSRRNSRTDSDSSIGRRSSADGIVGTHLPTVIQAPSPMPEESSIEADVPSTQAEPTAESSTRQTLSDSHRLRISIRTRPFEGSWDEDSAISQTSSTSGYRESYPVLQLNESLETSPRTLPPLASPDIQDFPSTSSAVTENLHSQGENSSPDGSFNENGERRALLTRSERLPSEQSPLMSFDQEEEETTLI